MADSETPLVRSATPITAGGLALGRGALLAAALFVFGSGMLAGQVARTPAPPPAARIDPCALPAGVLMDLLGPVERALIARRALHCADLSHGRIDAAAYRAAISALDAPAPEAMPLLIAPPPPAMIWAATVRSMSSQYAVDDWSAKRALGAPDVFPAGGDQVNAWASEGADDRVEYLELGLERAAHISALEIFETFNPGAVSRIELIGRSGTRTLVHRGTPAATGRVSNVHRTDFACSAEPIVAVRVTLDSPAVEGWNELDAVGAQPCAE